MGKHYTINEDDLTDVRWVVTQLQEAREHLLSARKPIGGDKNNPAWDMVNQVLDQTYEIEKEFLRYRGVTDDTIR